MACSKRAASPRSLRQHKFTIAPQGRTQQSIIANHCPQNIIHSAPPPRAKWIGPWNGHQMGKCNASTVFQLATKKDPI